MRLLKFDSRGELSLTNDLSKDATPCYAILSHTWGPECDEVTFKDLENGTGKRKEAGYNKIRFCGEQAQKDGLQYFWVDTCCIDKSSSSELQESITSMFRWYRDAVKCYVYLPDVTLRKRNNDETERPWEPAFRRSRWFTRGWTLQELLAPTSVQFFSREEELLGDKRTLEQQIHEITRIPVAALRGTSLSQFGVDERLRWTENRKTQKEEDKAYCLLGIFNVFMPLIYGEGENAFVRLRAEIGRSPNKLLTPPSTEMEDNGRLEKAAKSSEITEASRKYLQTQTVSDKLDQRASNLQDYDYVTQLTASACEIIADFLDLSSPANHSALDLRISLRWFLQTQEYETFAAGQGHDFLCYLAGPGNGKTALARHLVTNFIRTAPSTKYRKVIYIPCERLTAGPQIVRSDQPETEHAPSKFGHEPRGQGKTVERLFSLDEEAEVSAEPSKEPYRGDNDQQKTSQRQAYQPADRFANDARQYRQRLQRLALDPVASMLISLVGQLLYQDDLRHDTINRAAQSMQMDPMALSRLLGTSSLASPNHHDQLWDLCEHIIETIHQTDRGREFLVVFDEVEQIPFRSRERFIPGLKHFAAKMHSKSIKLRYFIACRPVEDLVESLQDLPLIDEKAELKVCLASLYYKELHSRRDRVVKSSHGTNQWIWGNPDFRAWNMARSEILWIEGKPGCGKSTLAKEIQSHLNMKNDRRAKNEAAFNIAGFQSPFVTDHFYSARQHAMGVSHEMMLRSLLYQILQTDSTLFAEIQGQFRALRATSKGPVQWTWDDLEGAFQGIKHSRGGSRKIFCILDAMDESKNDDRNAAQRSRVLQLLRTLCSDGKSQAASPVTFKFIVLSRPARDIQRGLKGCRKIEMHKENARDIRLLVDQGLKSLRELMHQDDSEEDISSHDDSDTASPTTTLSSSVASRRRSRSGVHSKEKAAAEETEDQQILEMRKYLIDNADGVILWVLLVIQELSVQVAKGFFTFKTLKEKLTKLPMDLTEFYEQIVKNLNDNNDEERIKMARKMLIWVSFSQRPLTIYELWEVATMPLDTPATDFDSLVQARVHKRSPTQLWLGMLEFCGPFIEVTHEGVPVAGRASNKTKKVLGSETVQILHQTVKEFLVCPEAGPFRVNPDDPGRVFDACLNYITLALPIPRLPLTTESATGANAQIYYKNFAERLADRLLLSYCLLVLKKHRSDLSENASVWLLSHDPQIWFLLADWPGILAMWTKKQTQRTDGPSGSTGSATSTRDQHGWQRIERHGLSESTYESRRPDNFDCFPPSDREFELIEEFRARVYVAACRLGHESVVDLLLHLPRHTISDIGQDVMVDALTAATTVQDETQVALLCRSPLFREVGDNYRRLQKAVLAATQSNNIRLVKILLDNWSGRIYNKGYPLHIAARSGSVELAEYLAWKVVNIDCLDADCRTVMDVATARGWEPMVRMLRSLGAKTSSGLREHNERVEQMRKLSAQLAQPTPSFST